jgi:hypothetical protein
MKPTRILLGMAVSIFLAGASGFAEVVTMPAWDTTELSARIALPLYDVSNSTA